MASIKVLSKPDYELTLTSEEKKALEWLIGEMDDGEIQRFSGADNLEAIQGIWKALIKV